MLIDKFHPNPSFSLQIAFQLIQIGIVTQVNKLSSPLQFRSSELESIKFVNESIPRQTIFFKSFQQNIIKAMIKCNTREKQWVSGLKKKSQFSFIIDKYHQSLLIESKITNSMLIINGTFLASSAQPVEINNLSSQIFYQKLNKKSAFNYSFDPIQSRSIKFVTKMNNFQSLSLQKRQAYLKQLIKNIQQELEQVLNVLNNLSNQNRSKFKRKLKNKNHHLQKQILKIYRSQNNTGNLQAEDSSSSHQASDFIQKSQIVFENVKINLVAQKDNISSGGYFNVKKCKVQFQHQSDDKIIKNVSQQMAVKQLKRQRRISGKIGQIYSKKIQKEKKLLKNIKNSDHFLKYYYSDQNDKENFNKCFMELANYDLFTYLKFNRFVSISDLLQISNQILQALTSLHMAFIVHRDIKPSNFLVKQSTKGIEIKLIDLSESVDTRYFQNCSDFSTYQRQQFGYTLPYSPLQCSQFKKKSQSKISSNNGISAQQIDYWSVGIILYELFQSKSALNYFKPHYQQIVNGWGKQFCLSINMRNQFGLQGILAVVRLVFSKMVVINQKERKSIHLASKVFQHLSQHLQQILRQPEPGIDLMA